MTPPPSVNATASQQLHVICERDVGLFSLIQQVVSNVPWALSDGRVPIAVFEDRCAYWTPRGYQGRDTVWEYYFEPLVDGFSASVVTAAERAAIRHLLEARRTVIDASLGSRIRVSNHFGHHASLRGKTLPINYKLRDPSQATRKAAAQIIVDHVRPRRYIADEVERFHEQRLANRPVIGVHIRGTDSTTSQARYFHRGALKMASYFDAIDEQLAASPASVIFVATDEQSLLEKVVSRYANAVHFCESIRHQGDGESAGRGPTGGLMPAFIAEDRDVAARNGEEAVREFLLLCRSNVLIHNGASMARTVLLARPELEHVNIRPDSVWLRFRLVPAFVGQTVATFARGIYRLLRILLGRSS